VGVQPREALAPDRHGAGRGQPRIELDGVGRRFGSTVAVQELSLAVASGELLVLLGGSGSGKTTTLRMINRLIEPTSGSVRIDGVDTGSLPGHELRRRIGYAFQRIGLFPHLTVAENVGVTPSLLGWGRDLVDRRIDEMLDLVDLDPRAVRDRFPDELSGGQQQRVGVARALAGKPSVVLLDEPFGALDPLTRDRLHGSFAKIRRELGLTGVFVTHDMAEALRLADRIAVLRSGRLVQIGTPADLLRAPADDYVRDLVETPRRQAELIESLLDTTRRPGP
jgi:osmoprotectant transport system ATP-binding protein